MVPVFRQPSHPDNQDLWLCVPRLPEVYLCRNSFLDLEAFKNYQPQKKQPGAEYQYDISATRLSQGDP